MSPSSIARQIALTEAEIAASNQRLRQLRGDLRTSAMQGLRANRVPLLIGGIAVVTLGLLMYPRKRAIMARARWILHSPMARMLVPAVLPLMAKFMPHKHADKGVHDVPSP